MKPEEVLDNIKNKMFIQGRRNGKYLETEMMEMIIEALEKQIAKKPEKLSYEPLIKHGWKYECPKCSKAIGLNSVGFDFTDDDPFCPSCGQKIDWEVKE